MTRVALRLAFDSAAGKGGGLFTAVDITAAPAGLAQAVFGAPLPTFLVVSQALAVASQRLPTLASLVGGLCGFVLVALSCRHCATRSGQPANGRRPLLGGQG